VIGKLRYAAHQIPALFRPKPKVKQTLSAVITVGTPESAAVWSERLGRTVAPGEKIDLGVISESYGAGIGVKASG